jgi:predicted dehydrogenase
MLSGLPAASKRVFHQLVESQPVRQNRGVSSPDNPCRTMTNQRSNRTMMNPKRATAITRRRFLGGTLAATTVASSLSALRGLAGEASAPIAKPAALKRQLKLGVIGCGGRGHWIANLFRQHGGYEIHALADYFAEVANTSGYALGVDPARRFSTLSGYKRLLESGVEAVAIETPPYFLPEHARAAVEAGLHVYMAKPVAADVPGCLGIEAAARKATEKQRCFFVDYQMPTDPANNEVLRRIRAPGFGNLARLATVGVCGGFPDPPKTANLESRLRKLIWVNDVAMGCDYIGNYDIHAIDAALWAVGQRPVAAMGASRICRPEPHGDSHDVCGVIFEYADGLVHDHFGQALKNLSGKDELSCRIHGQKGNALLTYWGQATFRCFDDEYSADVANLYEAGAARNIGAFYQNVTEGRFVNETVQRSVDGALTCILGREAAARRNRLTMEQLLKENTQLPLDLSGLKT